MRNTSSLSSADVLPADLALVQTTLSRRLAVEFIGTFWLVLGGCGSAVVAAGFPKFPK